MKGKCNTSNKITEMIKPMQMKKELYDGKLLQLLVNCLEFIRPDILITLRAGQPLSMLECF